MERFTVNDLVLLLSYDEEHLPAPDDTARVDADIQEFVDQIDAWCDARGVAAPERMVSVHYAAGDFDAQHRAYVLLQSTNGLSLSILGTFWSRCPGEPLGKVSEAYTMDDECDLARVIRYMRRTDAPMDAAEIEPVPNPRKCRGMSKAERAVVKLWVQGAFPCGAVAAICWGLVWADLVAPIVAIWLSILLCNYVAFLAGAAALEIAHMRECGER